MIDAINDKKFRKKEFKSCWYTHKEDPYLAVLHRFEISENECASQPFWKTKDNENTLPFKKPNISLDPPKYCTNY